MKTDFAKFVDDMLAEIPRPTLAEARNRAVGKFGPLGPGQKSHLTKKVLGLNSAPELRNTPDVADDYNVKLKRSPGYEPPAPSLRNTAPASQHVAPSLQDSSPELPGFSDNLAPGWVGIPPVIQKAPILGADEHDDSLPVVPVTGHPEDSGADAHPALQDPPPTLSWWEKLLKQVRKLLGLKP